MPKPIKKDSPTKPVATKARPSADPKRRVHQQMAAHLAQIESSDDPWEPKDTLPTNQLHDEVRAYMSSLGKKGGKVSGSKRMENLTDAQRRDIAVRAAQARWKKKTT